jgi:ubiquinone biosynthesis protein UbiJ
MAVTALAAARRQLRKVADQLETLQLTLLGIQGSLPEPLAESVKLLDVEEMDAATELRAVIGCVLNDYIGPAMRDLRDALAETETDPAEGGTAQ